MKTPGSPGVQQKQVSANLYCSAMESFDEINKSDADLVLFSGLTKPPNIGPDVDSHDTLNDVETVPVDEPPDFVYNSEDVLDIHNPNEGLNPYNPDDDTKQETILVVKDDEGPFMKLKAKVTDDRKPVDAKDDVVTESKSADGDVDVINRLGCEVVPS